MTSLTCMLLDNGLLVDGIVPWEKAKQLAAEKRLALVTALHDRLGAGSAAAYATHDVLQKIGLESGLWCERETYAQVVRWRKEAAFAEFLEMLRNR